MKSTREAPAFAMIPVYVLRGRVSRCLLDVRLDGRDGVGLRVLVAGDAAFRHIRQFLLEVVLGEREIGNDKIMRDVLVAVENLLGDPEGERRNARRD